MCVQEAKGGCVSKLTKNGLTLAAAFLALLFATGTAFAQSAQNQILQEITRLRKIVEDNPSTDDDWKGLKGFLSDAFARTERSARAGRLYVSLHDLERFRQILMARKFRESNTEAAQAGRFEADWRNSDKQISQLEQKYRAINWDRAPAAVRAVAETSWGQTRPLYGASLYYAKVTDSSTGFYYLGQSQAVLDYALYCQQLKFPQVAAGAKARSVAPEIQKLDARIVAAYQPPRSIDNHSDFIRINSTLKVARELDEAGLYYGSMYKYLDTLRVFGLLDAAAPNAEQTAKLKEALAAWETKLSDPKRDFSIGQLFLQMAARGLDGAETGDTGVLLLKNSRVVIEHVLPAYREALEKAPPVKGPAANTVRVTLVRWPYT